MIPKELEQILSSDPDVMGGAICFTNSRIPVVILLDNLAAGVPMDEFYDAYPSLTPEQVTPVMRWANEQARRALGLERAA